MDGFLFAYLIGIFGFPAQLPVLEPLALMVLPDRLAVSRVLDAEPAGGARTEPQGAAAVQLSERPVVPGGETGGDVSPDQVAPTKLSRAALTQVVAKKMDAVRHCYELGLAKDETFTGTVEMGWKIQVDGHVASVNVVGATKRNDVIEDCLLAEVMRWTFPPASEPTVVGVYPFVFDANLLLRRPAR